MIIKAKQYFSGKVTLHGRRDRFRISLILSASDTPAFMSPQQLMMTNDKKGVFQITVDLKSLQIKLLQNVNSKSYLKNFRFYKIFYIVLLSDPFKRYNSQLGLSLNPDHVNNSIASRQIQAISFHLIAMINQLILSWIND